MCYYKYKIQLVDSPICSLCNAPEGLQHVCYCYRYLSEKVKEVKCRDLTAS